MPIATPPSADNLLLGRGAVYVDRLDANGARTGEFHLGNCDVFELSTTDETLEKYSMMTAEAPLYKSVLRKRTVELRIQGNEFSSDNLKLLLMGTALSITQSANAAVTNVAVVAANAVGGRWYEIGYRDVSNVVATANSANVVATEDYVLDADRGRVYIVPGGDAEGFDFTITTMAVGNVALSAVAGGKQTSIDAFVRFVGDPAAGPALEVECWKVSLNPEGALGLIADDWGNWTLKGKIQDATTLHADCPYYRVTEPA